MGARQRYVDEKARHTRAIVLPGRKSGEGYATAWNQQLMYYAYLQDLEWLIMQGFS